MMIEIRERLALIWAALRGQPILYRVDIDTITPAGRVRVHTDGPAYIDRTVWAGDLDETPLAAGG